MMLLPIVWEVRSNRDSLAIGLQRYDHKFGNHATSSMMVGKIRVLFGEESLYQFGKAVKSRQGAGLELDFVSQMPLGYVGCCHEEDGIEWYRENSLLKVQREVESTATRRPSPRPKGAVTARRLSHDNLDRDRTVDALLETQVCNCQ
jgi:hypothetical protein